MKIKAKRIANPLFIFLFLGTVLSLSPTVHAAPIAYADFEQNGLTGPSACGSLVCKWWKGNWNNNNFRIPMQGSQSYLQAWISTSIYNEGQKSFGAWLKTPPAPTTSPWNLDPSWQKQRIEFEISNSDYYSQHLDDSRYYGVAMYIHPQSADVLKKGNIFMQTWQSTNPGKHPPFSLRFEDDTDYKWSVNVSRDSTSDPEGYETKIYTSSTGLAKGVWHEFIVRFRPSVTGQGAVQVWHNGGLPVVNISQSSGQNLGYAPDSSPVVNDSFAVRFGAYRQPEPNRTTDVILMFDQAKYGTSYTDVDP